MKFTLITFDNEERTKGRGYMKRVKQQWVYNTQNTEKQDGRSYATMLLNSRRA